MTDTVETFDAWCVVELFGHNKIAGHVSEQTIGAGKMVRVDVPATTDKPGYTKYFGNGAIYAITPCSEEVARLAAHQIERWSSPIPVEMPRQLAAATGATHSTAKSEDIWDGPPEDEDDEDDDEDREM